MTAHPALLRVDDLAIGYGGKALAAGITALFPAGSITCLMGPNGVGKTTLLRTLLGLMRPLSGSVRLGGAPLGSLSRREIASRVALVPQAEASVFSFTALDLVLMGRTAGIGPFSTPTAIDKFKALDALDRLGIAQLAYRDTSRLSGGQRQLVLIARALAQEAPVLILDEPTASLDIANALLVLRIIERLAAEGKAVLVSTHDPGQALHLNGQVLGLQGDGMALFGAAEDILTGPILSRLYGTPLSVETLASGRRVVAPAE